MSVLEGLKKVGTFLSPIEKCENLSYNLIELKK
jgi:hypothetical protein